MFQAEGTTFARALRVNGCSVGEKADLGVTKEVRGEGPETACSESGAPSLQLRLRPGASPAKPTRPAHRDPDRCQLG